MSGVRPLWLGAQCDECRCGRPSSPATARRGAAAILLVLSIAAACSERPADFRVDLPVSAADRSAIVAAWDPDDPANAQAFAVEISEDHVIEPFALSFDFARGLSLAAAFYTESLDRLFIDRGPIARTSTERRIPVNAKIFESRVDSRGAGEWALAETMPAALELVRLPALSTCIDFDVATYTLSASTSRRALFAIGAGSGALVATEGRMVYYVEADSSIELAPTQSEPCGEDVSGVPQYYGAYREESGSIWLVARCGETHRAELDLVERRLAGGIVEGATHRNTMYAIAGPPSGIPHSLFTLSDRGDLDLVDLDASISTQIAAAGYGEGGVVHLADREALFAWSTISTLVHVRPDGAMEPEALPSELAGAKLTRIARAGELGLAAGNDGGEVFYRRTDTWRLLAPSLGERIEAIAAYKNSALILDGGGKLRLYASERRDFCDPIDVSPTARHLAVAGDAILVAGEDGTYRWLTPR